MLKEKLSELKNTLGLPFYILKLAAKMSPAYVGATVLIAVVGAGQPILSIWLTQQILDRLLNGVMLRETVLYVGCIILANFFFSALKGYFSARQIVAAESFRDDFKCFVGEKIMRMDYAHLEDPKVMDLKEQALRPIIDYGTLNRLLTDIVPSILNSIFLLAGAVLIVSISFPLLLLPILLVTIINVLVLNHTKNIKNDTYKVVIPVERKIGCYMTLASDYSLGKDVRLYRMDRLIMNKIRQLNTVDLSAVTRQFGRISRCTGLSALLSQLQLFLIYGFISYQALFHGLGIADFTFYTGIFLSFGTALFSLADKLSEVLYMGKFFEAFREFEAVSEERAHPQDTNIKESPSIEFEHVSFSYPNTDTKVLDDISFEIRAGERVAIVGQNGAGKTTLVKLLCGLYRPDSGRILLNGKEVDSRIQAAVSTVFQDYKTFAFTVYDNIVLGKEKDADLSAVLSQAGLSQVVDSLPERENTYLTKLFEETGIDLSGGQGQRLAIARALYKDSPVVVLDEPTAALDPIAEEEIFGRFGEVSRGKTAVMISHRLSSTRLCDKILVLQDGHLAEEGSHQELMGVEGGAYREMFSLQAKYYI